MKAKIFPLIIIFVMIPMCLQASNLKTIYFFPVQFKTDIITGQERSYIEEVIVEEMGAMFWLETLTSENIGDEYGQTGQKIAACKTSKCARKLLKRAGINRLLIVNISRIKRRVFQFEAIVLSSGGKVLFKTKYIERGGQGELKYAVTTVFEQLFISEIKKYANRITTIVETTAITSTEADASMEQAAQLADSGQVEQAIELYQQAIKNSPKQLLAFIAIAKLYVKTEEYDQAISAASRAIEIDGSSSDAYLLKAEAHLAKNQVKAAIKNYQTAINLEPAKLIEAQFKLAALYENLGQNKAASKVYAKLIEHSPKNPEARVNLGILLVKIGHRLKAIEHLIKATEIDEHLLQAYPVLAKAYENTKQWEKALDTYIILVEKMPDCSACYYNMGIVAEELKLNDQAIEYYRQAIEFDKQEFDQHHLDAIYNLANLLFYQGNHLEAKDWLESYIKLENRADQKQFIKRAKQLLSKCNSDNTK